MRWWGREVLREVSAVVELVWAHGLAVVVTMHHADAVCADPVGTAAPLTALWQRIAAHFAGAPRLAFELLNEPRMTPEQWNALLPAVLAGCARSIAHGR